MTQTVLVIDDDREIAELIGVYLATDGYPLRGGRHAALMKIPRKTRNE